MTSAKDQREIADLKEAVVHINQRFINDIGNRIFFHNLDDKSISNKLFSKKLPVYLKDTYLDLPTNQFTSAENDGFDIFEYMSNVEKDDLSYENIEDVSADQ